MPDFNIKNNPVFKNTMRKLETSDRAHANVFNALFETLLDNDNSLKKTLEKSGEDLDEKIDSKGGDISKTKVGTIKESSAEFPIPEKDDTQETLWGKLKKWQQDCLAKFGNYVLTSMITNQHLNDTNRVPSSALVYLMQQAITQLNMDLRSIVTYTNFRTTVNIPTNVERDTVVNFTVPSGYEALCLRNIDTSIHPMLPISSIIISENSVSIGLVNLSGSTITDIELTGTVVLIRKHT